MLDRYHKEQQALWNKHLQEKESLHNFQQQLRDLVVKRHKEEERKYRGSDESNTLFVRHKQEWSELTQSELLSSELLNQQQQQELANFKEKYLQLNEAPASPVH